MRETRKRIKIIASLLVIASIALLWLPTRTADAINSQVHFQGKLANPDGTNVTNGTYSILFTIYDGGTDTSGGTNVWSETQSVTVADGVFNVQLGSVNATLATAVDFTHSPLYLSVKVGADAEMTPRILFTAAPYAFNSAKADNAATLNGIASTGYVQLSPGAQQTGSINVSGNIQAAGTYNSNTFTSSSLVFGATSTASVQSGASQALNLTGNAASTISTSSGNLTLQAGSGTVSLGTSTVLNANAGLSINSATTSALTLDSGTTGAINIGTNANGKAITIGNTTSGTTITQYVGAGTNALSIQGASATYLSVDATNNRIYVSGSTASATPTMLVLGAKNTTGDPAGQPDGSEYYNSTNSKFRCLQNSIWQDCTSGFNTITKTADQAATPSSTAFQDDNTLFFNVNANTTYTFDAIIPVNSLNATADFKYTFTTPAGATLNIAAATYNNATGNVFCNIVTSGQTCATTVNSAVNNLRIQGYVTVAGTAGSVRFRFAQNTSSTTASPIIKKGATLSWHQSN